MNENTLDQVTKTKVEAAVFRRLIAHLDAHKEVQNIDLMILADFCRNCLSKWYVAAAAGEGAELDLSVGHEAVYGMTYAQWKEQHQLPASPEQLAQLAAKKGV